jgi:hypothetical protein
VFAENSLEFCLCHTVMVTRKRSKGYGAAEKILIAILQRCYITRTEWTS